MASLLSYDDALARVLERCPVLDSESVELESAQGRVLRQDVMADRDQPPFNRSAMDGFAVSSEAFNATPDRAFPVTGAVAAGGAAASFQTPLTPGTVRRIATGAPLPVGADATIPVEQSVVEGQGASERVTFAVPSVKPWQNVHRQAVDARRGMMVIAAGTRLGPQHLGIAAAVGAARLTVSMRPRITILTTGDEVRPATTPSDQLEPQQIRNSNGPMLAALLTALLPGVSVQPLSEPSGRNATCIWRDHLLDDPEVTRAGAREAISRSHLVITNGGVSVGERDFLPAAWRHLGLDTVLHGVAIQPGKPVFVACDPNKLVLGLPGNPVSVLCTAHLFAWPVIARMTSQRLDAAASQPANALPWRDTPLRGQAKGSSKRTVFRAAAINRDGSATVIPWQGSGDLMHTATMDGWVRLPLSDEPIVEGAIVPFLTAIR